MIKNTMKHGKVVLLAKTQLNSIEALIFNASTESYNSYDEFDSVNNVLREYDEMKEEIKNSKNFELATVKNLSYITINSLNPF